MLTSAKGVAFITQDEKCRLTTFDDGFGHLTIGWGHTGPDVVPGKTITQAEADALLAKDLRFSEHFVESELWGIRLKQNEFDALVSLCYNVGAKCFYHSDVRRFLATNQDRSEAAKAFLHLNHVHGRHVGHLTERRIAEAEMFLGRPLTDEEKGVANQ